MAAFTGILTKTSCIRRVIISVLLLSQAVTLAAKSYIESCASASRCMGFVSYSPDVDTTLAWIADLFSLNPRDIMAANNYEPPSLADHGAESFVIPSQKLLRIPISCACMDGIRRADSTFYSVKAGDSLYSIASQTFRGLVSPQQIQLANEISDGEELSIGQSLAIPFPCGCHENQLNGRATIFLSYAVNEGDSIDQIATEFGVNQTDLVILNEMKNSPYIVVGDVIEIPIPACTSSFGQSAADYNLLVAEGSYSLTAGGCVQCSCPNTYYEVLCTHVSPYNTSCQNKTCKGSSLQIGEMSAHNGASGCYILSCIYGGYKGSVIISRLEQRNVTCNDGQPAPAIQPSSNPLLAPNFSPSSTQPLETSKYDALLVSHREFLVSLISIIILMKLLHL